MAEKRSGRWELSCGHTVRATLDIATRHRCPECDRDVFVVRAARKGR